ncbi:MAG: DUF3035 domain-containing protein [Pseudomonadota bacterium]
MINITLKFFSPLLILLMLLILSSCNSAVKKKLGVNRTVPDEFSIVAYDPLVIPDNFELVEPGSNNYGTVNDIEQVIELNNTQYKRYEIREMPTSGEQVLLSNIDDNNYFDNIEQNQNIREIIDAEYLQDKKEQRKKIPLASELIRDLF